MIFQHDRTLELVPASVRDYRELARRRLPRQLFDYIDGGAYEEHTLAANSADLEVLGLRQRVLRDVSDRRLARTVLGHELSMPVILAPDAYEEWLRTPAERADELVASLGPCPEDWLRVHPVDPMVNRPDCDTPACIEAIAEGSKETEPAAADDSSGQLDLFG